MTAAAALDAIRQAIRYEINNGIVTERQLARLSGLSQPHVHHVLSGAKPLLPPVADRLCRALQLDVAAILRQRLDRAA
jgi:transcriptional regulator with XRE-family HTH domain